jgi:hypothetical protein
MIPTTQMVQENRVEQAQATDSKVAKPKAKYMAVQ